MFERIISKLVKVAENLKVYERPKSRPPRDDLRKTPVLKEDQDLNDPDLEL